jgi:heme-degrading monooxygenase HmoA
MKRMVGPTKRPIAELLIMTVNAGAETERSHLDQEAWQILRRKPGYVTHRIYQHLSQPLQWLVYSEWESTKAADGARQHLQGKPLMRRARATLSAAPQRLVLELVGPITSTKGLDLADGAVAARLLTRLKLDASQWREKEQTLWQALSSQPGHVTHVLLRGLEDPLVVGSFSHWADAEAFQQALAHVDAAVAAAVADALAEPQQYVLYKPLRD